MKVRVLSDLHIEFNREQLPRLPEIPCDVVVLAGDTHIGVEGVKWAQKRFPDTPVIYVPGNHEFYHHGLPSLIGELREAAKGSNVSVLENSGITIDGVNFLGCTLWSDFNLFGKKRWVEATREAAKNIADYRTKDRLILLDGPQDDPKKYPTYLMPYDACDLHNTSMQWLGDALKSQSGPVVVVTHFAASTGSVSPEYARKITTPAYVSNHDDFVRNSKAQVWIHGHTHKHFEYQLGDTRVICNPLGYVGLDDSGFNPELVVEIKHEEANRQPQADESQSLQDTNMRLSDETVVHPKKKRVLK